MLTNTGAYRYPEMTARQTQSSLAESTSTVREQQNPHTQDLVRINRRDGHAQVEKECRPRQQSYE